ncbi:hypothetical protein DXA09_21975 [Absiella sp. AM54-8XD]|uniref:hypothetical protein n=1 Tax=unclassified Amedibacterium TaxID=3088137 RepID=UPI000E420D88|nr:MULTISPECIES: hypothetical protein [unclassified Absiella]RGC12508.1 hypothetical protein DXA09_21975 [Absiella sp. AM54-8XD]RGC51938.1 hypothetical protein DW761_07485 [Absiella sp. AM29-15]
MNSLSKREKTLIYILVCMIVFIGGIFLLVLPSFEQYSKAKSAYDEASDQLVITKASVPDYTTLDANVKKVKKELEEIRKSFYEEMNKEDLDQEITQLVVEHNLVPVNLSMSEIASEEVMNYETYLKSQTKEQSATENKTETTKKTTAKVYNVTMVVQGTVQDVQSLVNDANKTYSMKIGSVQYSEQQEDTKQMTITFKVYMM